MRMWLVNPAILCRRHLLGEHVESHMFLGTLRLGKNIDGYIAKDLFQPRLLYPRHKALVEEMIKRGYNHNSPLTKKDQYRRLSRVKTRRLFTRCRRSISITVSSRSMD
jgi:hypothetical protein